MRSNILLLAPIYKRVFKAFLLPESKKSLCVSVIVDVYFDWRVETQLS